MVLPQYSYYANKELNTAIKKLLMKVECVHLMQSKNIIGKKLTNIHRWADMAKFVNQVERLA